MTSSGAHLLGGTTLRYTHKLLLSSTLLAVIGGKQVDLHSHKKSVRSRTKAQDISASATLP
jgi:hypothetical protein